eukprot:TRINITY_DN1431_c0_g1_i1.p1 TRINITY_DN1431_c0_g1~~TRINITY_DN1431_c0_g1_i1.p1  ORF type:complete len:981 (-),score=86.55 TRINITY_DN1431_c0_g1_i1:10863-13805(-)
MQTSQAPAQPVQTESFCGKRYRTCQGRRSERAKRMGGRQENWNWHNYRKLLFLQFYSLFISCLCQYQQKALSLKEFTVEMYQNIRDDFIKMLKKMEITRDTDQEPSIITHQTQKDVFLESDLDKGLELCESQFDLAETLPLIGLAVQLKRYSGSFQDPWLIGVRSINSKNVVIDSISLYQSKFKLGLNEEKDKEYYNGLLPLFGPKEEDLCPIAQHPLYHVLVNFVTTQNLDVLHDYSYLALLANSALYLLLQPLNEWREILFKRVLMSILMIYGKNKDFNNYSLLLRESPEIAVNCDTVSLCSDLSKPFVHLLCMQHLGKIVKEEIYVALQHFYIFFFGKLVASKKHLDSLKVVGDQIIQKVKENIFNDFEKYRKLKDLWTDVNVRLKHISNEITFCPVVINLAKLEKNDEKVSIKTLNAIYEYFIGKVPSDDDYLFWLYCAIHHKGKRVTACERETEKIRHYFFDLLKKDLMRPSVSAVYSQLKDAFVRKFKEEHMYLIPMSFGELNEYCNKTGADITKYEYVKGNNLINNACMCKKCPFYLQIQDDLQKHLSTWSEKCPKAFHKTVKRNLGNSPEAVLDKVLSGELAREKPKKKWTLADFNSTKEEAITYIALLQKAYRKIEEEEAKYSDELKALEHTYAKESSLMFHHAKMHGKYGGKKEEGKAKHKGKGQPGKVMGRGGYRGGYRGRRGRRGRGAKPQQQQQYLVNYKGYYELVEWQLDLKQHNPAHNGKKTKANKQQIAFRLMESKKLVIDSANRPNVCTVLEASLQGSRFMHLSFSMQQASSSRSRSFGLHLFVMQSSRHFSIWKSISSCRARVLASTSDHKMYKTYKAITKKIAADKNLIIKAQYVPKTFAVTVCFSCFTLYMFLYLLHLTRCQTCCLKGSISSTTFVPSAKLAYNYQSDQKNTLLTISCLCLFLIKSKASASTLSSSSLQCTLEDDSLADFGFFFSLCDFLPSMIYICCLISLQTLNRCPK